MMWQKVVGIVDEDNYGFKLRDQILLYTQSFHFDSAIVVSYILASSVHAGGAFLMSKGSNVVVAQQKQLVRRDQEAISL
ncbi:hypothetical protein D3C74_03640 [compost metagenome]